MSRRGGRYTRQVLRPGEKVVAVGRFHWLYTVIAVLYLLLLGRFLIGLLIFARMMIEKWTTEIVITSDRLIYKRGWIARHVEEIALNRIEEVLLDQTVVGRVLGYGRMTVAGTGRGVISLPGCWLILWGLGVGWRNRAADSLTAFPSCAWFRHPAHQPDAMRINLELATQVTDASAFVSLKQSVRRVPANRIALNCRCKPNGNFWQLSRTTNGRRYIVKCKGTSAVFFCTITRW